MPHVDDDPLDPRGSRDLLHARIAHGRLRQTAYRQYLRGARAELVLFGVHSRGMRSMISNENAGQTKATVVWFGRIRLFASYALSRLQLPDKRPHCRRADGAGMPCAERVGSAGPAHAAAAWLAAHQSPDGSVGVWGQQVLPSWPTALAVLAWRALDDRSVRKGRAPIYADNIERTIRHILSLASRVLHDASAVGHNARLIAWPWVEGTHAWVEPTAMSVLALKACEQADHPRTREGVRLLVDRQLPAGGCNYGNTAVLGRSQRPHVQPTGLALLALAGEADPHRKIERSLAYLLATTTSETTSMSLAWSLLGLTAHRRRPPAASQWLSTAAQRSGRTGWSPLTASLLLLADKAEDSGLVSRDE